MATPPSATATQIANHLTTSLSVTPRPDWIQIFLSSQKPTTPLPSLLATAKVRFLNAEITSAFINSSSSSSSSSPSAAATTTTVPVNIHDASQPEHRVRGPIGLQVIGVEDLSRSRWSQLEDLEAAERGETTKGREIVRMLPTFGQQDAFDETRRAGGGGGGFCKLRLQDANGVHVWAIELRKVPGIRVGMNIGSKVSLSLSLSLIHPPPSLSLQTHISTLLNGSH